MGALLKSKSQLKYIAQNSSVNEKINIDKNLPDLLIKYRLLETFALEDKIDINYASQLGSQSFLNNSEILLPHIFLLDNGNLRAVWRNGKNQVGLQFLNLSVIQYVLIRDMKDDLQTSYGRSSYSNTKKLIYALNLESLVYAE